MKKYLWVVFAIIVLAASACSQSFDTVYTVTFERLGAIGP